jgi:hypothetical protein
MIKNCHSFGMGDANSAGDGGADFSAYIVVFVEHNPSQTFDNQGIETGIFQGYHFFMHGFIGYRTNPYRIHARRFHLFKIVFAQLERPISNPKILDVHLFYLNFCSSTY